MGEGDLAGGHQSCCQFLGALQGQSLHGVVSKDCKICFTKLSDKICALRAKGALNDAEKCPKGPPFKLLWLQYDMFLL